jgi:uncharacterized OB-fold protein
MAPVDLTPALSEPAVQAAAEGRLLLARCRACGEAHYYPRVPCPFCGSTGLDAEDASGAGRIYSFSVTRQRDEPYVIA